MSFSERFVFNNVTKLITSSVYKCKLSNDYICKLIRPFNEYRTFK